MGWGFDGKREAAYLMMETWLGEGPPSRGLMENSTKGSGRVFPPIAFLIVRAFLSHNVLIQI